MEENEKVKNQKNQKPKKSKTKKGKVIRGIVISLSVVILLAGAIVGIFFYNKKLEYIKDNTVPNLIGMKQAEAKEVLESTNWKYWVKNVYVKDTNIAINEVIDQSIEADTVVDKSQENIQLDVCCGYWYESIPDVKGMTVQQAKATLKGVSEKFTISVKTIDMNDESIPDNTVYDCSVEGQPRSDSTITLYAKGGTIKKFPDMLNMTQEEAGKIITDCGMKYELEERYSDTFEKGRVINFSSKTYVTGKVETYTLTVSKGKDPRMNIPEVAINKKMDEGVDAYLYKAIKQLEAAGCKVKVEYTYNYITDDITAWEPEKYVSIKQSKVGRVEETSPTVVLTVNKPSIKIDSMSTKVNSVGGVDTTVWMTNLSNKQIKKIYIEVAYYDRVGDKAYCTVRDRYIAKLEYTGPLNAGESTGKQVCLAVIYNSNTAVVQPRSAEIIFSDGTKQTLTYNGGYWYTDAFYGGTLDDD